MSAATVPPPFDPPDRPDGGAAEAIGRIADHCRAIARAHMAVAAKAEGLKAEFLTDRRFRAGLRALAQHHRRAAWRHLQLARRADSAGCDDFDPSALASA